VFDDYSMLELANLPANRALTRYEALEKDYGAPQGPPRAFLRLLLEEELWASRAKEAQAALDLLNSSYGKQANTSALEAKIKEVADRPPPKETVKTLLETPRPTPDEVKKYLGEWHGHEWTEGAPKTPIQVRVFAKDGKAHSELLYIRDGKPFLRMPGEYLKLTEDGLHFGHMNGIRPKGVIIYEGRLRDGVLEGVLKIRGIQFTYPPGEKPPVHRFSLEQKR